MKSLITVTVLGLFVSTSAWATNYECITSQVTALRGHSLVPQTAKTSVLVHSIIHFNDENGDMWTAVNNGQDSPFIPNPFRIVKKREAYQEITAVSDATDDSPRIGTSFRMWEDKDKTVIFLFYSGNEISTGTCHKYDKEMIKIDRCKLSYHSKILSCSK